MAVYCNQTQDTSRHISRQVNVNVRGCCRPAIYRAAHTNAILGPSCRTVAMLITLHHPCHEDLKRVA
ncbi:hypothetical protein E2C01_071329 [Portunus trituberculatus]|uniref:Uncharacterized protein n=1 Tax=Portunus trituberculatus TaxID=210409 RepID=A0A5B7I7X7_PORTR|nr:hypothetical protein [Portunus trituberculatus]